MLTKPACQHDRTAANINEKIPNPRFLPALQDLQRADPPALARYRLAAERHFPHVILIALITNLETIFSPRFVSSLICHIRADPEPLSGTLDGVVDTGIF